MIVKRKNMSSDLSELIRHVDSEPNNLTSRFVVNAFIVIGFFAILISFGSYYLIRSYNLNESASLTQKNLIDAVYISLHSGSLNGSKVSLSRIGRQFTAATGAKSVVLFDNNQKMVWSTIDSGLIDQTPLKKSLISSFLSTNDELGQVQTIDQGYSLLETWKHILKNDYPLFTQQVAILTNNNQQQIGTARLAMDVSFFLQNALFMGLLLFTFICISSFVVFYILFRKLKKVLKQLDKQEEALNDNVRNLSETLEANQGMRANIQTASARAVELNEQFLRRVGADLHDGPAQMIGYANMRMTSIAASDAAKDLGQEFQSVKKALEDSLDDIRGISSGLVLPELKSMTLKKCLQKVISIHSMHSDAEVLENFVDLPNNVPLPIKICAYRFVQEGLNNAEQHGKAKRCRVTVRYSKAKLYVSLKDNGTGFRTSLLEKDSTHLGLIGLKDRIESIGGSFTINSELEVGTAIKFTVAC